VAKRKQRWKDGDLFAVPLVDSTYALGQVIDLQMPNVVRCAIYSARLSAGDFSRASAIHADATLISLVATTREHLDFGVWTALGSAPISVRRDQLPNERFRAAGWVGAKIHDASIVEEFCNAFHALLPWDDWADPDYLDRLLVSPSVKPKNLVFKGGRQQ